MANCPSQQPAEAKWRKCICSPHWLLPGRLQNCYWLWLQAYLGMCHMFGLLCDPPWLPCTPESFFQFIDFYTFLSIVNEVPCESIVQSQGKGLSHHLKADQLRKQSFHSTSQHQPHPSCSPPFTVTSSPHPSSLSPLLSDYIIVKSNGHFLASLGFSEAC